MKQCKYCGKPTEGFILDQEVLSQIPCCNDCKRVKFHYTMEWDVYKDKRLKGEIV